MRSTARRRCTSLAQHKSAGSIRLSQGVGVVLDSAGQEVARAETFFALAAGQKTTVEQQIQIVAPRLWSVSAPNLYGLRSEVFARTYTADVATTTFGIRTIAYDKDQGFLLNGRPVKMRGVNLHHDAGALGAAVPERVWQTRLETLKAMGANAIRTSHNPPAPEFLDLCDRLGFLVMAEAFDEWTQPYAWEFVAAFPTPQELARAGKQKFFCLRIPAELKRLILFQNLVQRHADLFFVLS